MTFVLGNGSLKELVGVHPTLVVVVKQALAISSVDFGVHDGLRTEAEQLKYVRTGVSQTMNSKHRVQPDGFGHAVDLVPYINGKLRWEWEPIYKIAAAMRDALDTVNKQLAKDGKKVFKIRWGGCWKDLSTIDRGPVAMMNAVEQYGKERRALGKSVFTDGPHFEVLP